MLDAVYRFLPEGDPEDGLMPASGVPVSAFTTEDRTELRHEIFETADGSVTTGVWQCAPMSFEVMSYSVTEIMTVLSGSITVIDADGNGETFTAGDTFLIPKGAHVTLEITETFRKYYMKAK